jgi:hypothetical protein
MPEQTSGPKDQIIPSIALDNRPATSRQDSLTQTSSDVSPDSDQESNMSDDYEDDNDVPDSDAQDDTCGQNPDGQQREDYQDLGTLLRRCSIPHYDRNIKIFWTNDLRRRILTRERIVEELQAYQMATPTLFDGTTIAACADDIMEKHHKVFAILTLLDKGPCIRTVMNDRLLDTDLPLCTNKSTLCPLFRRSRKKSKPTPLTCLSSPDWRPVHREAFFKFQYSLDPQFLNLKEDRRTPEHRNFGYETVLPFMEEEERQRGGYGIVTKIKIHPDCHGFHDVLRSVRLPSLPFQACIADA